MKYWGMVLLFSICTSAFSQNRPKPFELAREAIAWVENEEVRKDSLKKCFVDRWSIDLYYGQRFISASHQTGEVDTVTLTDFTQKRGFFGFGGSYFLTDQLMIGGAIRFLILPREQEISSFSGSGGSGTGSGGLSFDIELSGRYYFKEWGHTRPYIATGLGRTQLIAKGGSVEFSLFSGQSKDIGELNVRVLAASISGGISHRLALGSMLDLSIGYTVTTKTTPIGGITSPGGFNASAALRFIVNP